MRLKEIIICICIACVVGFVSGLYNIQLMTHMTTSEILGIGVIGTLLFFGFKHIL